MFSIPNTQLTLHVKTVKESVDQCRGSCSSVAIIVALRDL